MSIAEDGVMNSRGAMREAKAEENESTSLMSSMGLDELAMRTVAFSSRIISNTSIDSCSVSLPHASATDRRQHDERSGSIKRSAYE
jgi:hypothetical protein